ncbi:MAG: hypothetical protein AAFY84_11475 [Pseudomonadota bacterium]
MKMKYKTLNAAQLLIFAAVAGCATASDKERQSLLDEPIDCEVAEEDIAALEAAMPSGGERAVSAVRTLSPVGAATSILTGSYRGRAKVLVGRTQGELNARIEDIQETCGLEPTDEVETAIEDQEAEE